MIPTDNEFKQAAIEAAEKEGWQLPGGFDKSEDSAILTYVKAGYDMAAAVHAHDVAPAEALLSGPEYDRILAAHDELAMTGPFWWSADSRGATVLFSQDAGHQALLHAPKIFFRNIAPEGFNESMTGGELAAKSDGFPLSLGGLNNPAAIALASAWLVPHLIRQNRALSAPSPIGVGVPPNSEWLACNGFNCYQAEEIDVWVVMPNQEVKRATYAEASWEDESLWIDVEYDGRSFKSPRFVWAEYYDEGRLETLNPQPLYFQPKPTFGPTSVARGGEPGDGVALIAAERQEQIHKHGFDVRHDEDYGRGELVQAAQAAILLYANYTSRFPAAYTQGVADIWPWKSDFGMSFFEKIKGKSDVDKLKVAGALIAAEIDRLQSSAA